MDMIPCSCAEDLPIVLCGFGSHSQETLADPYSVLDNGLVNEVREENREA